MTHRQSRERRAQIRKFVKEGGDRKEAAKKFGVTNDLVKVACKGLPIPHQSPCYGNMSNYEALALLLNTTESVEKIGQKFGVSRQAINHILGVPNWLPAFQTQDKAR